MMGARNASESGSPIIMKHLKRIPQFLLLIAAMPILFPQQEPSSVVQGLSLRADKPTQRLVLVGGGHAHVQVIKALNHKSRPKKLQVTLIDVQKSASYSGMVPGAVSKLYTPDETQLRLQPLADWAGIDFINDKVVDMDLDRKTLRLEHTLEPIPFDAVSLDIGSASRGLYDTPGALQNAIPTRPVSDLIRRIDEAEEELKKEPHKDVRVVVIGGGAAGIELSLSIRGRWKNMLGNVHVTLLNSGPELLPDETQACRDALAKILHDRDIEVRQNCLVDQITDHSVCLVSGEFIPFTHCLWATGAGAHGVAFQFGRRGLAISKHGWIRVNEGLQSVSHPFVFAAGDCASIEGRPNGPPPKAGVYAVRAGPVLIDNLTNYLNRQPLVSYKPQDDFLKLMVCGDGTALGFRFGIPIHGKWVWQLKDSIDQKFMDLFRQENLPILEEGTPYDKSQYDAGFFTDQMDRLKPEEASLLLQRTDDDVDFNVAWKVLRDMTNDEEYRNRVLHQLESPVPV